MGEVYRARDIRLDRTVAIKILPPAVAGDPQFREQYQVSTDSAVAPRWRGNGRELFYLEAAATHAARQPDRGRRRRERRSVRSRRVPLTIPERRLSFPVSAW